MTARAAKLPANNLIRQLACTRCGAPFECRLDGTCWCAGEPVRLPVPDEATQPDSDCLCPACLRAFAAAASPPQP